MKSRGRRGPKGSGKFSEPFTTGDTSALHTEMHRHIASTLKLAVFAWSQHFPHRQDGRVLLQRILLQREGRHTVTQLGPQVAVEYLLTFYGHTVQHYLQWPNDAVIVLWQKNSQRQHCLCT